LDIRENDRTADKSTIALYIEHEGVVKDILVLSDQENKAILAYTPNSSVRFIVKEIST